MIHKKFTLKVEKEGDLTLGISNYRPTMILYADKSEKILERQTVTVKTGIKKITSESGGIIFHILGEAPTESNHYIETTSSFVGLNEEITVDKTNHHHCEYNLNKDDDISKMVGLRCFTGEFVAVDSLEETNRGEKGFGSTGVL
ncbi:hypothetical protein NUSPORA_01615 [Nucleospora cyclopteri]